MRLLGRPDPGSRLSNLTQAGSARLYGIGVCRLYRRGNTVCLRLPARRAGNARDTAASASICLR